MNDLKNNVNLPLLYEVRKDAFAKSRDVECGEHAFSIIYHMDLLARTAIKEGLLALEEAAKEFPSEIRFYQDIQSMVSYVCDGLDSEDIIEILTVRYWVKNLQGEEALLYFMLILSIIRIQDGTPPYHLEHMLKACLPDDAIEKYTEYKKQRQLSKQA